MPAAARRRLLERVAPLVDRLADDHPEPCPVGELARGVGRAIRRELGGGDGPAQVASEQYRENFETIFGKRVEPGQA